MGDKKYGADWFTTSVYDLNELKVETLIDEFGGDGWLVYSMMYREALKTENYEFNFDVENEERLVRYLSKKARLDPQMFLAIREFCFDMGLFDKKEFEKRKVLTNWEIKRIGEDANDGQAD